MKNKKLWIFIAIIIIIIILLVVFKFNKKDNNKIDKNNSSTNDVIVVNPDENNENEFIELQDDGTKLNKSEKFSQTKTIEGLEISNIKLTEKDNATEILADIKNTTDKDVEGFYADITFLDKNGQIIVILGGYIPSVEANGMATLNTNSSGNFANAYDFTVTRTEYQGE